MPDRVAAQDVQGLTHPHIEPARPTAERLLDAVCQTYRCNAEHVRRRAHQPAFRSWVYLLRRVANLSLRQVSEQAGVSIVRIAQIQSALDSAPPAPLAHLLSRYKVKARPRDFCGELPFSGALAWLSAKGCRLNERREAKEKGNMQSWSNGMRDDKTTSSRLLAAALVGAWLGLGAAAWAGDQVSEAAMKEAKEIWQTRCTTCHGPTGKGDGPAGVALNPKPRDLSSEEWQKSVTDEYIEKITVGGGQAVGKSPLMAANPDLAAKPEVVRGLTKLVRELRGKK